MTLAKNTVIHAVLALAMVGTAVVDSRAQTADSPELLLQLWQAALDQRDHSGYLECLHPAARQIPEYASEEAMDFWADEIRDLVRKGFAGQFKIEIVTAGGDRFPPGSVRAYPIVNGQPIGEAIVLVEEAGHWTILRLFS